MLNRGALVLLVALAGVMILNGVWIVRSFRLAEGMSGVARLAPPAVAILNARTDAKGRLVLDAVEMEVCEGTSGAFEPTLSVTADARVVIEQWIKRRVGRGSETVRVFTPQVHAVEAGDVQVTRLPIITEGLSPGEYYLLVGFTQSAGRQSVFYRVPFRVLEC